MSHDLIERYVYAVTRHLPVKMRKDVETELKSLISDMLEERCGDAIPDERQMKAVLNELGTPTELAEKYSPDHEKALISAPYYIKYKFIMKIVLLAAALGLTLTGVITFFTETGTTWYVSGTRWVGTLFTGLVMAFGIVTIIFAVLERKGIALDLDNGLDNLPTVPQKQERISVWEPVGGILFTVVFTVVFLAYPQILGIHLGDSGEWTPVFNISLLRSMWYVIIAMAVLGIGQEIYRIYVGRYTKKLALVTAVTNGLSAVLTYVFFRNQEIMNSQFLAEFQNLLTGNTDAAAKVLTNLNLLFIAVVIFALVIDLITVTAKAYKYD